MLMVAPRGSTKEVTSSDTPRFSSQHSILTGRVAPLLLVENATNCALLMPPKNLDSFILVKKRNTIG